MAEPGEHTCEQELHCCSNQVAMQRKQVSGTDFVEGGQMAFEGGADEIEGGLESDHYGQAVEQNIGHHLLDMLYFLPKHPFAFDLQVLGEFIHTKYPRQIQYNHRMMEFVKM